MTVADALRAGVARLVGAGVSGAPQDARRLMAFALGLAPDRLTLHLPDPMPDAGLAVWDASLAARIARQPVAQITGQRLFWGRNFRVTPDTLDPRPETEVLVAAALEAPFAKMLDLGTGTGCILLSCLADNPMAQGTGTDLSHAALAVARDNAMRLGLTKRATFMCSDWFTAIDGRFDLIVSNPPYIAASEMAALDPDVRNWEPHLALTPGGDGLDAYRAIASGAPARLLSGGRLMVEIGPTQGDVVQVLFQRAGLTDIRVIPDMDGRDRGVIGQKP